VAYYVSEVSVRRTGGPDKAVTLPAEPHEVVMGAHDEIAAQLGVPPEHPPHAATLDYVVGATAACLAGAFSRALAARGVTLTPSDHHVQGWGDIVERDRVLMIERIRVRHEVRLPPEHHAEAVRVHGFYQRSCYVSRSLEGAFDISSELEFETQ
jgi:organic hydroperoxide reductase OsmC/OhrA